MYQMKDFETGQVSEIVGQRLQLVVCDSQFLQSTEIHESGGQLLQTVV